MLSNMPRPNKPGPIIPEPEVEVCNHLFLIYLYIFLTLLQIQALHKITLNSFYHFSFLCMKVVYQTVQGL